MLTKKAMKNMGVDKLANFQEGTINSKQIQLEASGEVSVSISDVVNAIPFPGLGVILQKIIKAIAGDVTASGQVSFDGIAKMSAHKETSNNTTAFDLDFIAKLGGQVAVKSEGGVSSNEQSRSIARSAAYQLRISYNFKDEKQIREFLNGNGLFKEVTGNNPSDNEYTISSTTNKISTGKFTKTESQDLEEVGLAKEATKKISDKKVEITKEGNQKDVT
ncbi:MAG: hypothetical protein ACKOPK_00165, partial [Dolichospermum sp.]